LPTHGSNEDIWSIVDAFRYTDAQKKQKQVGRVVVASENFDKIRTKDLPRWGRSDLVLQSDNYRSNFNLKFLNLGPMLCF
jgi:hypothetical protein